MIPNTREEKTAWIRRNLFPHLHSQLEDDQDENLDEEDVGRVEEILAGQYLDETGGETKAFLKLLLPLISLDLITSMPAVVYGLVISMIGTWILLVESDVLGKTSIAARSQETLGGALGGRTYLNESEARRLARRTVVTNIGLIWLTGGFLLQIIGVWAYGSGTILPPIDLVDTTFQLLG